MERNIKFDKKVYETDIKELNSMLDELMKRKTMKRAYKKYLLKQEKEIAKFNCIEKSTYNKIKFDFSKDDEQKIVNKPVNLKFKSDNFNKQTDYKFEKGFC